MMVDTHAYFGQPGVFPQLQPQTLVPQSLFGAGPGQYAPAIGQAIGGWQGYPQPGIFPTQTLFGSPQLGGYPGLAATQPGQFGLPIGTVGGRLGRPHSFGFGPQAVLPTLGWPSLGDVSAWQPQIASQLLGTLGRSFQPYQVTSPMACAA